MLGRVEVQVAVKAGATVARRAWAGHGPQKYVQLKSLARRGLSTPSSVSVENAKLMSHALLPRPVGRPKAAFTNFQNLMDVLKRRIEPLKAFEEEHSPEHIEDIRALLSAVEINPSEWEPYTHFVRGRYTRTLVGYDEKFVALLLCWHKGQRSPIHDHAGASCWVKVLSGCLQEVLYERRPGDGSLVELGRSSFDSHRRDVSYMNDSKGLHAIINPSSDQVAVSLHIYAPPFRECQIFSPVTGAPKSVSMVHIPDLATDSDAAALSPLFYPTDSPDSKVAGAKVAGAKASPGEASAGKLSIRELVHSLRDFKFRSAKSRWESPKPSASKQSSESSSENSSRSGGGEEEIAAEFIAGLMARLELTPGEVALYASPSHFSEFHYTRNLVHLDGAYSLMVLCWCPGQATPPHSHGLGRRSWVKVLQGTLTLERLADGLDRLDGLDKLLRSPPQVLEATAGVTMEDERLGRHRLVNASLDQLAVSVHLYSPPLKELHYRDKGALKTHPVVCYALDHASDTADTASGDAELDGDEGACLGLRARHALSAGGTAWGGRNRGAWDGLGGGSAEGLACPAQLRGKLHTNLETLSRLLDYEFESALEAMRREEAGGLGVKAGEAEWSGRLGFNRRFGSGGPAGEARVERLMQGGFGFEERLTNLLRAVALNQMEWLDYARWDPEHFTRVLLASSPYYSLVLGCWDRGQYSPPHDHAGSRNWIKVLEGSIDEVQYRSPRASGGRLAVLRAGNLGADSVSYLGPGTIHSCTNDQDEKAFTLHLYSPPYTRTHLYDLASGARTVIDIPLFDAPLPASPISADISAGVKNGVGRTEQEDRAPSKCV